MPAKPREHSERPFVLDVSRLVWRRWTRRLPTGIDRVCLAYLVHFGARSVAFVQWGPHRVVLRPEDSERLFVLLLTPPGPKFRKELSLYLGVATARAFLTPVDVSGRLYLNVGHTGLNAHSLPGWLKAQRLLPVYLVHDLIPITHPAYCREGETERHATRMRHVLESARGVICNSVATRDALGMFAGQNRLPVPDCLVAHLGIEAFEAIGAPVGPARPYFLAIGTIEGRKNHALLLDAWDSLRAQLGEDCPDLVLIGQRGWQAQSVFDRLDALHSQDERAAERAGLRGRVIELARCNDAELAGWIDGARAMLMPSHAEGFGLPVLESLSRGTPVIAADLTVYRELAGNVPCLVDPSDTDAWLAAITDYLRDGPEKQRHLAAIANYAPPTWPAHFAAVDRWLATLP